MRAGLASLALHGLGLGLLPFLSNFPAFKPSPLPASIKVTELTPKELNRIPAFTSSPKPTNSLPAAFYQPVLPIPPTANRVNSSSWLPALPALSPVVVASPPPSPVVVASPLPQLSPLRSPVTSVPLQPLPSPAESPSPLASPSLSVSPSLPLQQLPPPSPSTAISPLVEGDANAENPIRETSNRQAESFATNQSEKNLALADPPAEDDLPELVFNSSNTSKGEAETNYQNWASNLGISLTQPGRLSLQGNYPEIACRQQLQGEASVAILINKDKQPNSPEIVQSSGYQLLDEQAIADTMAANFDKAAIAQPYLVTVKYKSDRLNCPIK